MLSPKMSGHIDGFAGTLSSTYTDDAALAANNLVFLPAAGYRYGSNVLDVGVLGYHWSSSALDWYSAYGANFDSSGVNLDYFGGRRCGFSVRLITECQDSPRHSSSKLGSALDSH